MIILAFHLGSVATLEAKDNSVLVINPDAVETSPVPFEGLQVVTGRHFQVIQGVCSVQHVEFATYDGPELSRNVARLLRIDSVEYILRRLIAKRLDHFAILHSYPVGVKEERALREERDGVSAGHVPQTQLGPLPDPPRGASVTHLWPRYPRQRMTFLLSRIICYPRDTYLLEEFPDRVLEKPLDFMPFDRRPHVRHRLRLSICKVG